MLARSSQSLDNNNYVHSLPPFANEENKKLSKTIKELEAKLAEAAAIAEDNKSRADAIVSHMKNVQSEANHTQALYDAKNRQIETEEHFQQLADRELGRIKLEIKRNTTERSNMTDLLSILQSNIYKGNEKIEAIRAEFKLENDELNEWLRVQAEKEEDNLALVKYAKEDDTKEKELSLAIQKLVQQVNKKKALLTAEVTETQVAQVELENTTVLFKNLHQERQDLISKWENAVKSMKERDVDINNAHANYRDQKQEIRKIRQKIDERNEIYESQLKLNSECEKNITLAERRVVNLKQEQTESAASLQQFKDEVEIMKNTLNKSATELVNKRSELNNLKLDLKDRQQKLDTSLKALADLKQKMAELDDETISLESKAEKLESYLAQENLRDKELQKEIKSLRETQFRLGQSLFKLRQEEKNLLAEIEGGEAANRNLKSKINTLDHDALKQRAMIYNMGFNVQQLERKIRRLEGDRTDEEKKALLAQIDKLNEKLDTSTNRFNLLNNQLKKSQEELRHSSKGLENLEKTKGDISNTIGELNLYNESATNQLQNKVKEKENLMVEENILRLELQKLRSFVHARSDEVLTLETRKFEYSLALEERTKEIEIHKNMLKIQIKNAEDERHSATTELRDRTGKVDKLKRRYEILMTQFAPEEGEEEHSQAYYVIQAAQKREELQREGDQLDANIRRAEKEIKALENTLKLMNDRNEQYRANLYKAELDGKDLQHKELLETEFGQVMESFKQKRTVIQDLQISLQELEGAFNSNSAKETEALQEVQILETRFGSLQRDIDDQRRKKNRAFQFIKKASKKIRTELSSSTITSIERDFLLRAFKEIGVFGLKDLEKVGETYPEIVEILSSQMELFGIKPPSRSVSRVSSRNSNASDSGESVHSRTNSNNHSLTQSKSLSSKELSAEITSSLASVPVTGSSAEIPIESSQSPRTSTTKSSAKMATTNLGGIARLNLDSISLPSPPTQMTRTPSIGSLKSSSSKQASRQQSESKLPTLPAKASRGPITGSDRIKKQSRPGSAASTTSTSKK